MPRRIEQARLEARERGDAHYLTERPCKHGHDPLRRTSNGACVECERLRFKRFYEANRERECARVARYDAENAAARSDYRRRYREENRETLLQREADYRRKNRDECRERARNWHSQNREKAKVHERLRRARKAGAEGSATEAEVAKIFHLQGGRCANCGQRLTNENKHLDHIVPLSRGGSNWPSNLQYLCSRCNLAKWARDPIDFARSQGRLL